MTTLLVLPILIPLGAAAASFVAWRRPRVQGGLSLAGASALLAAAIALLLAVRRSGIHAVQMGQWPAPFGITFVADLFAALMVLLAGIVGLAVAVYSASAVDLAHKAHGYHPFVNLLLAGVCGAFLTGDIFNLYVWFEVMLISSFVLLALGGERPQLEGAIKYVTLNLMSSALFLAAVGILYGVAGTLNMADLSVKLADTSHPGVVTTAAILFLIAFGIKAGIFPLFFWLPAAYHTPPSAVSALFAGLLTKVGVYALVRMFTLVFTQDVGYTHGLLLGAAGLTMITGVLGAVTQSDFRRVLSFHIVSQIGYMVMGLALFVPLAVAGAVFYIAHHIIVKTNLFLVSGVAERLRGTYDLADLGGLYRERPLLAGLFLVSALSLAGVPPLSGFFAKLVLVRAGLETGHYLIAGTALAVGLLTLYSMTKIWAEAFWKAPPTSGDGAASPADDGSAPELRLMMAPVAFLACLTLALGLAPGPVLALCMDAAAQLLDPSDYVRTVLGAAR